MATTDHEGYHKIQCWIPDQIWDKIASLNFPNQTSAVTEAFNVLLDKSQENPNSSPDIPRLEATIEGLQMLLQERNERIQDLKKENDRLDFYAQYFKSIEHRRLEASTEEIKPEVKAQEMKPAREPRRTQAGNKDKALIKKICKNCGEKFDTYNSKKETCSDKCRAAFFRQQKKSTITI